MIFVDIGTCIGFTCVST